MRKSFVLASAAYSLIRDNLSIENLQYFSAKSLCFIGGAVLPLALRSENKVIRSVGGFTAGLIVAELIDSKVRPYVAAFFSDSIQENKSIETLVTSSITAISATALSFSFPSVYKFYFFL